MNERKDKNKMNCEEAGMLLGKLAFGEVDEGSEETAALRRHLESCEKCRELLGDIRLTAGLLTEAIMNSPAPKLSEERRKKLGELNASRSSYSRVVIAVAAAAAVLIIAMLISPDLINSLSVQEYYESKSESIPDSEFAFEEMETGNEAKFAADADKTDVAANAPAEKEYSHISDYEFKATLEDGKRSVSGVLSSDTDEENIAVAGASGGNTTVGVEVRGKSEKEERMVPLKTKIPEPLFEGTPKQIEGIKDLEPPQQKQPSSDTGKKSLKYGSVDNLDRVIVPVEPKRELNRLPAKKDSLHHQAEAIKSGETEVWSTGGGSGPQEDPTRSDEREERRFVDEFAESGSCGPIEVDETGSRREEARPAVTLANGQRTYSTFTKEVKKEENLKNIVKHLEKKPEEPSWKRKSQSSPLPLASIFKLVPVNPFEMTSEDRLSTFAIDVDTASYDLARRYIRAGYLPPPGSVRMEEFVNAFDYNYPDQSSRAFTIHVQAGKSPFGKNLQLLMIGVKARTIGRENHKPAHLVFLIDASGSMLRNDRFPLVQQALKELVVKLSFRDIVSIVTYSDKAGLIADGISAKRHRKLMELIDLIQCGGTTNMTEGLSVAMQLAQRHFVSSNINSIILCSDGVANVGETEAERILREVQKHRRQGITLNTAGFGAGSYNDELMEQLANRGDGQYMFVDYGDQSRKAFVKKLSAAIRTVGRDAKIQVEFNKEVVRRYRLIGYENRDIADADFRNDTVDAGEVGSGQHATALYELELHDRQNPQAESPDIGTVFVRYKNEETGAVEEISRRIDMDMIIDSTPEDSPRFYLAAAVAEFAEILRKSPHARDGNLDSVREVLGLVAQELPLDRKIAGLLELVDSARGLPNAP